MARVVYGFEGLMLLFRIVNSGTDKLGLDAVEHTVMSKAGTVCMFVVSKFDVLTRDNPGFPTAPAVGGASTSVGTSPDRDAAGTGVVCCMLVDSSRNETLSRAASLGRVGEQKLVGFHKQPAEESIREDGETGGL